MVSDQNNHAAHLNDALQQKRAGAMLGGGESRIERQHAKGKLTARERIDKLLDPSSFQEIDRYVVHRHSDFGLDKEREVEKRDARHRACDVDFHFRLDSIKSARSSRFRIGRGSSSPTPAARIAFLPQSLS